MEKIPPSIERNYTTLCPNSNPQDLYLIPIDPLQTTLKMPTTKIAKNSIKRNVRNYFFKKLVEEYHFLHKTPTLMDYEPSEVGRNKKCNNVISYFLSYYPHYLT